MSVVERFNELNKKREDAEQGLLDILKSDKDIVDIYSKLFKDKDINSMIFIEEYCGRKPLLKKIITNSQWAFMGDGIFCSSFSEERPRYLDLFERLLDRSDRLTHRWFTQISRISLKVIDELLEYELFPFTYDILDRYFSCYSNMSLAFRGGYKNILRTLTRESITKIFITTFLNERVRDIRPNLPFYEEILSDTEDIFRKIMEIGCVKLALTRFVVLDMFHHVSVLSTAFAILQD